MDLYTRVKVGTRVVVLPGGKPPAAAAMQVGPQGTPPGYPPSQPGYPPSQMPPGYPPSAMAR